MKTLENIFHDPAHPASYSNVRYLTRAVLDRRIAKKNILPWLESQDSYTLHRPVRYRFPRRMYNVSNVDDVWEADLADLRSIDTYNDGYAYLLVVIDVLSKYAWVEALQDKTSSNVTRAFARILARSNNRMPQQLQTDRGKEFIGEAFQEFLRKKNIEFRIARNPDIKASIAERFNRTLKERMWRYFTHTRDKCYINVLQKFVHAYNHARHSGIRMRPTDENHENARVARKNLIHRYAARKKNPPKYKVGDQVRISTAKAAFAKGYESGWSSELFKIHRISVSREPFVYILQDLENDDIDGIFYEEELTRVRIKEPAAVPPRKKKRSTRKR